MATRHVYTQHNQAGIVPKSDGSTTRVLLVSAAAARTEDVRLTAVPKYG